LVLLLPRKVAMKWTEVKFTAAVAATLMVATAQAELKITKQLIIVVVIIAVKPLWQTKVISSETSTNGENSCKTSLWKKCYPSVCIKLKTRILYEVLNAS